MRIVLRYILAICFLLSGLLKIFSLSAFEQEVQLYGDTYIGEWVHIHSHHNTPMQNSLVIITRMG